MITNYDERLQRREPILSGLLFVQNAAREPEAFIRHPSGQREANRKNLA